MDRRSPARRRLELPSGWRRHLAQFVAAGVAAEMSEEMLRVREGHLLRFAAGHPDPWAVDFGTAATWWSDPAWAPATQISARNALRAFYGWAIREGLTESDPTLKVVADALPRAWRTALTSWATELRARGLAESTIVQYQYQVRRFASVETAPGVYAHADPLTVERAELVSFLARCGGSENKHAVRTALVSFYRYLEDADLLQGKNPGGRLPSIRGRTGAPRPADDRDILAALAEADVRTLLMIRLGAELGLRRAEIASVHTRAVETSGLRVRGKGDRTRVIPLPADLRRVLTSWPRGWVFPGSDHGHLTAAHVGVLMTRVLPRGVTPHMLRHAAATAWHDAGLDIGDISPLLGHASVATTARYVLVRSGKALNAVEAAAARLHGTGGVGNGGGAKVDDLSMQRHASHRRSIGDDPQPSLVATPYQRL